VTSMRRLNRRLTRWQRYSARYRDRCDYAMPWGQIRAKAAVVDEQERCFWDETPEIWLGGPEGEAALIADVAADFHDPP